MAVAKKKNDSSKQKKINPFELKFNKSKHTILGKKKGNQDGAPVASRKRAYEQREKTLGVEYDRKNKISKIVDKRLGEKLAKSEEEKGAMRFTEERIKSFKKSAKFNLSDDIEPQDSEVLTHKGKSLSDIEKYDKSMLSDSDDDDDPGNLGSQMVKVAHFGGGEKSTEEQVKERISREDMISNLIAKTKLARHEKQSVKDELEIMTDSLDAKYQSLMSKVQASFRPSGRQPSEKDDFDKLAINLKIEADARATPAQRKLTEEEEALKERERLESLEAERTAKLNARYNSHLSADADVEVDAGLKADAKKQKLKNSRFEVKFADGKLVDSVENPYLKQVKSGSDEEEEEDDDLDEMDEEEEDLDDLLENELEEEEEEDVKDTKSNDSIPFVFEMPKNYTKFCALLEKYSSNMDTVLERLIKCHHPSLKEGNKQRLNKLFLMCLRWFDDMAKEEITENSILEINLAQKSMHELLKFDIQYGVRCIRALIRQHWKYREDKEKNGPATFGLISLLRLVSGLFPVSDSWHPVCTPAFFLATSAVSTAKISNLESLARQIILATTLVEYVVESKRYIPELVSFAKSALLLCVEEKPESFATGGFPISTPHCNMLCVNENGGELGAISLQDVFPDGENTIDEKSLRLSTLRALISLIQHLRVIYSNQQEAYNIIFKPFIRILSKIKKDNLPLILKDEINALTTSMAAECDGKQKLTQLSHVKTEKSMLKMLEPRFEWDFDPERPHKGKRDEKKKFEKELKNERRGAIKELRKDTAFLARKQMASVKAKDRARVSATKRLMGGLMQQQGEWNKEMRTNEVEKKKTKK